MFRKEVIPMGLTPRQEKFVQGLFKGLSQRQAYREAFASSLKWKDETVDNKAYVLAKHGGVKARLTELQQEVTNESKWTVERLIQEFEDLKNLTKREGEFTVTAKSLENIGKLLGMYETKLRHSGEITINIDIEDDDND